MLLTKVLEAASVAASGAILAGAAVSGVIFCWMKPLYEASPT
jgi:hypothetical protein